MQNKEQKKNWTQKQPGNNPLYLEPRPSPFKPVDVSPANKQVQTFFMSTANTGGDPNDIKTPEEIAQKPVLAG